jgi:4-hydroxybenzoate polyprenyltransferase
MTNKFQERRAIAGHYSPSAAFLLFFFLVGVASLIVAATLPHWPGYVAGGVSLLAALWFARSHAREKS